MFSHRRFWIFMLMVASFTLLAMGCARQQNGAPGYFSETSTVTAYRLNVRAQPSSDAHILGVIERGSTVKVLGRQNNWIKVQTPTRHIGWVYGAFLSGFNIPKPKQDAPEFREGLREDENQENTGEDQPMVL